MFKRGDPVGFPEATTARKTAEDIESRRREWNRLNAIKSRARRKYSLMCVKERREVLIRENSAILALLERTGVEVPTGMFPETAATSDLSLLSDADSTKMVQSSISSAEDTDMTGGRLIRLVQSAPGEKRTADESTGDLC